MPAELLPRGVSVDALPVYVEALPKTLPAHAHAALNFAVMTAVPHEPTVPVFYVHPRDLEQHGLPHWLRGCNRVGRVHPTGMRELERRGLSRLMREEPVAQRSLPALLDDVGACRLRLMKVDVEGLDAALVLAYVAYLWARPSCHADLVRWEDTLFEDAERSEQQRAQEVTMAALATVGYAREGMWRSGNDPILPYRAACDERLTRPAAAAGKRHWPPESMATLLRTRPTPPPLGGSMPEAQAPYACRPFLRPGDAEWLLTLEPSVVAEFFREWGGGAQQGEGEGCPPPPPPRAAPRGMVLPTIEFLMTETCYSDVHHTLRPDGEEFVKCAGRGV